MLHAQRSGEDLGSDYVSFLPGNPCLVSFNCIYVPFVLSSGLVLCLCGHSRYFEAPLRQMLGFAEQAFDFPSPGGHQGMNQQLVELLLSSLEVNSLEWAQDETPA